MTGKLVEPAIVPEVFTCGLGDIEEVAGNCFRFTFYTTQRDHFSGESENVVVAKIIIPKVALEDSLMMTVRKLGWGMPSKHGKEENLTH